MKFSLATGSLAQISIRMELVVPGGFNHNSINSSLDEMQNRAYYLYYSQTGGSDQRYWFHTKANLNILVNSAISEIKDDHIENEIIKILEVKSRRVSKFKLIVNPSTRGDSRAEISDADHSPSRVV